MELLPGEHGLPYTEVTLESEGLQLSGWHIPTLPRPSGRGDLSQSGSEQTEFPAPIAHLVHSLDYNAVIFDFRGHGDSDGRTITFGVKGEAQDVKATVDFAREKHTSSKMYGLGYSMGGAALVRMAAEQGGFDKIVVDSSLARAENVALHSMLWYFGPLKRPMWQVEHCWGSTDTGVDMAENNPEEFIGTVELPGPSHPRRSF